MKKSKTDYFVVLAGILLLGVGVYLVKSIIDPQGFKTITWNNLKKNSKLFFSF